MVALSFFPSQFYSAMLSDILTSYFIHIRHIRQVKTIQPPLLFQSYESPLFSHYFRQFVESEEREVLQNPRSCLFSTNSYPLCSATCELHLFSDVIMVKQRKDVRNCNFASPCNISKYTSTREPKIGKKKDYRLWKTALQNHEFIDKRPQIIQKKVQSQYGFLSSLRGSLQYRRMKNDIQPWKCIARLRAERATETGS